MLHFRYYQESLFGVEANSIQLEENSVERWLPEIFPKLFSREDFACFYKETAVGSDQCCPILLMGMLVLQFLHDLSDRVLVQRCRRDLGFHYALKIDSPGQVPSISSLVRFRSKLRQLKGDDFVYRRILRFLCAEGVLDDTELQAVDSTNTNCRGAVIDTYNLIATGIKRVLQTVSRCLEQNLAELAKQWGLSRYLCRSIKGQVSIDWHDEKERNRLLTEEIHDAQRLTELVRKQQITFPGDVLEALTLLNLVAHQDVEEYEPGKYRMVTGTKKGRVLSISDPQARHGRKSSSKVISGFKTHVLGTIESQFVTGIKITDASVHDSHPTEELIEQSEKNNLKPQRAVGDNAYGTGRNIRACAEKGVELVTKMGAPSHKNSIPKRDFVIDLEQNKMTCPAGQTTEKFTLVSPRDGGEEKVQKYHFDTHTCRTCEFSKQCNSRTANGYGRQIVLSTWEPEQQKIKAFNATTEAKEILRSRSSIERLISHLVKMGMRHARFFGMKMVQFQAYMTASVYNLKRYITLKVASAK